MTLAEQILVLGGIINLVYGFITGFILAAIRQKKVEAPKYLMFAHIGPLMQGAMLLGLVSLSVLASSVGLLILAFGVIVAF